MPSPESTDEEPEKNLDDEGMGPDPEEREEQEEDG
jgi:hypothetical protein